MHSRGCCKIVDTKYIKQPIYFRNGDGFSPADCLICQHHHTEYLVWSMIRLWILCVSKSFAFRVQLPVTIILFRLISIAAKQLMCAPRVYKQLVSHTRFTRVLSVFVWKTDSYIHLTCILSNCTNRAVHSAESQVSASCIREWLGRKVWINLHIQLPRIYRTECSSRLQAHLICILNRMDCTIFRVQL